MRQPRTRQLPKSKNCPILRNSRSAQRAVPDGLIRQRRQLRSSTSSKNRAALHVGVRAASGSATISSTMRALSNPSP